MSQLRKFGRTIRAAEAAGDAQSDTHTESPTNRAQSPQPGAQATTTVLSPVVVAATSRSSIRPLCRRCGTRRAASRGCCEACLKHLDDLAATALGEDWDL